LKINDLSNLELTFIINNIIKIVDIYNNKLNIILNINNLRKVKTYKYIRHVTSLPVNGQRTHTNRKTKRKFMKFVHNHVNKHIFKI
jgi:ribosomal protein S13